MKRIFFLLAVSAGILLANAAPKDPNRYASLDGKSGETLFNTLSTVTNVGYKSLSYDGLWTAYEKTDLYPAGHPQAGKIWDMYGECDNFTFKSKQCGNYSDECDCYNREHSIPKSWFGGTKSGIGCDIFHLVPTDGYVNNKRGNLAFGEVNNPTYNYNGSKVGPNSFPGGNGTVFEPIDEYKGDLARGYFGTIVKWMKSYKMTTGEGADMFTDNYTAAGGFGLTQYSIDLLMKWHREDPVSEKEVLRNDGIEATQGNRNPFIDYPYLAEYFWGTMKGQTLDMRNLMSAYDEEFELGKSDGYKENSTMTIYTIQTDDASDLPSFTGSVAVYTLMGKYIGTMSANEISNLAGGMYIIQTNRTMKIMVQK